MTIFPEPQTATEAFSQMLALRESAARRPQIYFSPIFDDSFGAVLEPYGVLFVFPESKRTEIVSELVRTRTMFVEIDGEPALARYHQAES